MAKRATTTKKEDSEFLAAVKFVQPAQSEIGLPYQTHSRIDGGYVTAYNGILAAGHPLVGEYPQMTANTRQLIKALETVALRHAVTITETALTVKDDKFKAKVELLPNHTFSSIFPNPAEWPLNNSFIEAAIKASVFTKEGAQRTVEASVRTTNGTIIGTNGAVLVEAWHGIATPPDMIIPKVFIDAIAKVKQPVTRFGYNGQSLTIYFENDAWLMTQLYEQKEWPDLSRILGNFDMATKHPIPANFFEAVKSVSTFAEDKKIYFDYNEIRSHPIDHDKGAQFTVNGIPSNIEYNCINASNLLTLEPIVSSIDLTYQQFIFLYGEKVRVIMVRAR